MKNVLRMLLFIFFPVGLLALEVIPTAPPTYPESARAKGIEGDVTLEIRFIDYRSTISISDQSQFGILGRQARSDVWKWRFPEHTPGRTIKIVFHYRLNRSVQKTTVNYSNHHREVTITAPKPDTQISGVSFR